ncbi:hypothetical protein [uncultured Chryseobacterium sp.]|uniref:hypothetical protein n=1 Tax=uncultured Chryseobacterium sp. TaxID=259322 RepID=UPI00258277BF|nr:hypothetical protein [uncultured Chryseobacterium sp.]
MKNLKYIQLIVILLIISNILLILFIFLRKPPHPEGPKNIIIERLHFDQKQINEYENLIDQHRMDIHRNEEEMMMLKSALYENILNENTPKRDSLVRLIGNKQEEAEMINYHHFMDIKKLCRPDQQKDFEELVHDFGKLFSHKKPR